MGIIPLKSIHFISMQNTISQLYLILDFFIERSSQPSKQYIIAFIFTIKGPVKMIPQNKQTKLRLFMPIGQDPMYIVSYIYCIYNYVCICILYLHVYIYIYTHLYIYYYIITFNLRTYYKAINYASTILSFKYYQ